MTNNAIDNLAAAQRHAMSIRPRVGGFPYVAEALRQAGVSRNVWQLPSCQSLYMTALGPVATTGTPVAAGILNIPPFDRTALITAIRTDQQGGSTFPEFLQAIWNAGVVSYDVDFEARNVVYYGCNGEQYREDYPAVELNR